jgi:hypothetical protein
VKFAKKIKEEFFVFLKPPSIPPLRKGESLLVEFFFFSKLNLEKA